MEIVYYYDSKYKSNVDELTKDDAFMRVDIVNKEASSVGTDKKEGYYLYIKSSDEETLKGIDAKITEACEKKSEEFIKKAEGSESQTVIDYIHKEADEAAEGMGAIFG
ncbi:hypothetical protein CUJ83_03640 [Methanocella sp. CWC-04]|uniref:Uncharacterized protein n=1 Tax=Methanooceanicella nereidis TaxID=2052831 RepID=A0AAP2W6G7_9EURY|nr:hypothetical protein [Methanocella sp. CWC-04]MCD1294086.1 hypothetical protein [Methanocella sp. CWC-04]